MSQCHCKGSTASLASLLGGDEYSICLWSDHPENITLFYRELVLKTFLCCLYVTVVNFSMELIMNRSHGFLQSVITVADMILYQHSTKKAACFQFIGSNSMALPEELLAKYFLPLFFLMKLLFCFLYLPPYININSVMDFHVKYTLLSKSLSSWNSEKLNPACLSLVVTRLASRSIFGCYCPFYYFC